MHSISTPENIAFNKKIWITQILQLFLNPNGHEDINGIHQRACEINALIY